VQYVLEGICEFPKQICLQVVSPRLLKEPQTGVIVQLALALMFWFADVCRVGRWEEISCITSRAVKCHHKVIGEGSGSTPAGGLY